MIGNQIGALNVPLAKKYAKAVLFNSLLIACLVSILFYVYRLPIIRLFTDDSDLTSILLSVIPMYCIFNLFDSIIMVIQGCVRALGI